MRYFLLLIALLLIIAPPSQSAYAQNQDSTLISFTHIERQYEDEPYTNCQIVTYGSHTDPVGNGSDDDYSYHPDTPMAWGSGTPEWIDKPDVPGERITFTSSTGFQQSLTSLFTGCDFSNYRDEWAQFFQENTFYAYYSEIPNKPPEAEYEWEGDDENPLTIHFDASGSSDEDGEVEQYDWDFDGDTRVDRTTNTAKTSFTYEKRGTYQAELVVRDDDGARSSPYKEDVEAKGPDMVFTLSLALYEPAAGKRAQADDPEFEVGDTVLVHITVENTGNFPLEQIQLPQGEQSIQVVSEPEDALAYVRADRDVIDHLERGAKDTLRYVYEAVHIDNNVSVLVEEVVANWVNPKTDEHKPYSESAAGCSIGGKSIYPLDDDEGNKGCANAAITDKVVVNSTSDAPRGTDDDGNPLEGCDTGETITRDANTETECTLRAAIEAANADDQKKSTIEFNIPEEDAGCSDFCTIRPKTALPPIEAQAQIDGATQPGYADLPLIFLDGTGAGVNSSGLRIVDKGDGSSVKALAIGNFGWHGILVKNLPDPPPLVESVEEYHALIGALKGIQVDSSFIGVDPTGAALAGNGRDGIHMDEGGNHRIQGNVISGNDSAGVYVFSVLTTLTGNYIGTNRSGQQALGNGKDGVYAEFDGFKTDRIYNGLGPDKLQVGGTAPEDRNVISGNKRFGIYTAGHETVIQGNRIGTNAGGMAALPNEGGGIVQFYGNDLLIGGRAGNLISGNGRFGVLLGQDYFEETSGGVAVDDGVIQGNRIGTTADGTAALPNQGPGIMLGQYAFSCLVGGTFDTARNLISGNAGPGILIDGQVNEILEEVVGGVDPFQDFHDQIGRPQHMIQSNWIGTDVTGTKRLPNQDGGIRMFAQNSSIVGHTLDDEGNLLGRDLGNVIAGNIGPGISIEAYLYEPIAQTDAYYGGIENEVHGNLIGVDATGEKTLGNSGPGIQILSGATNRLSHNIITGNGAEGVLIDGGFAYGNILFDNLIGGLATSDGAPGNRGDGIQIRREPMTPDIPRAISLVRNGNSVSRNTIIGNAGNGISLIGHIELNGIASGFWDRVKQARVRENKIGTNDDLTQNLGNKGHGIYIEDATNTASEGGLTTPAWVSSPNIIAYNGGAGIAVASGEGHLFPKNQIFGNGGYAIDLGINGYTPNDGWDRDDGPNLRQNFPDLYLAVRQADDVIVFGALSSAMETDYNLVFFANTPALGCSSGNCQTEQLLTGNQDSEAILYVQTPFLAETTEGPTVNFVRRFRNVADRGAVGDFVTALAVDPDGNTSELSNAVRIEPEENVRIVPLEEGQSGLVLEELGLTVTLTSNGATSKAHATVDTLYVTRHDRTPISNQFSEGALTPDGSIIIPDTLFSGHYWSLAASSPAEATYTACLDASDTSDLGSVDTFVLLQRERLGTFWMPHDTYLDASTSRLCADGLTGFGEFSLGTGGVAPMTAPTLVWPENGSEDVPLNNTSFSWDTLPKAATYDFQLALSPSFTPTLVDTSGLNATSIPVSISERQYLHYWRVRGVTSSGEAGPWSGAYHFTSAVTGVTTEDEATLPEEFTLEPNYPNPFNPQTTIGYSLPEATHVHIAVYDALGREVAVLVDGPRPAGRHETIFDAARLTSGMYFYRMRASNQVRTGRMLLLK